MTVFLYTDEHRCRRATLLRADQTGDEGGGDADEPAAPPSLLAKLDDAPRMEDGARVRTVTFVQLGLLMEQESAFNIEQRGPDGRWREVGGGAGSEGPTVYGALSYVDDRVARWQGEPLDIRPYCSGPVEWLACATGGERPCERCDQVALLLAPLYGLSGHGVSHGNRPVTCRDACPKYPENPALQRVSDLASSVQPWQPRKAPLSLAPSLYRDRDECRRDHPSAR